MTKEFIVPTGTVLKEYLEEFEVKSKECAQILEISEKNLSDLLNGHGILTKEIAIKLEDIIKGVPASYWLNYESKYQEYKSNERTNSNTFDFEELTKIAKRFRFNSIFNGLDWDLTKQANEMLKLLKIKNFEQFETVYSNLNVDFMEDGGELEAISIWLNLAEEEIEIQNKDLTDIKFNLDSLIDSLNKFKRLALNTEYENSLKSARKLLNRLGVYLVFESAIENSKVRGALTTYQNNPAIFLSGRFKTHDHVWFALMHEIGHLIKHYIPNEPIVTLESEFQIIPEKDTKEAEANEFARDFFIEKSSYITFIETQKINVDNIHKFAYSQNVLPGIVVARLQHDGIIGFDKLNYLKNRQNRS